jgi:hypothetical protein
VRHRGRARQACRAAAGAGALAAGAQAFDHDRKVQLLALGKVFLRGLRGSAEPLAISLSKRMNTTRAVDDEETAERDLAMVVASFMPYQKHLCSFGRDLKRQVRKQVAEDVVFSAAGHLKDAKDLGTATTAVSDDDLEYGFSRSYGNLHYLEESSPLTTSGFPEVVATSQDSTAFTLRRARSSHSSRKSDHNPVADAIALA